MANVPSVSASTDQAHRRVVEQNHAAAESTDLRRGAEKDLHPSAAGPGRVLELDARSQQPGHEFDGTSNERESTRIKRAKRRIR